MVDGENYRVQVLNPDFTFATPLGKGQFQDPFGIACDSIGKVYWDNHRISRSSRKLLRMFGQYGGTD